MEGTTTDRRVRRTKARLRQALAQLLLEKDLSSITVRELTDLADVNRGTFYTHYRDLYDMLEQMEQEMFQELEDMLDSYASDILNRTSSPILRDVFRFVMNRISPDIPGPANRGWFPGSTHPYPQSAWRRVAGTLAVPLGLSGLADHGERGQLCPGVRGGGAVGLIPGAWLEQGAQESQERCSSSLEQLILSDSDQAPAEMGWDQDTPACWGKCLRFVAQ